MGLVVILTVVAICAGPTYGSDKAAQCQDGLIVPVWEPRENLTTWDVVLRGSVYFFTLLYLFLGVSIISDRFMSAIEVITSQERKVSIKSKGEKKTVLVRVWNETVANLTLMALGSSAPEILLSVIEIWAKNFQAGDLGPGTIVGSAAYNLFVIIAICVNVVPNGETRRIKQIYVFFVTATWSVFAYIWLYIILAVSSRGVVEVWEGLLTFMFFPATVLTAYIADRKIPIHKLWVKLFKTKVGAAENADIEMSKVEDGFEEMLVHARQQSASLLKELRKDNPDKTLPELKKMAQDKMEQSGPKSRAFYRIQATRSITGGSFSQKKESSPAEEEKQSLPEILDETTYVRFEHAEQTVLENIGTFVLKVVLDGPGLSVPLMVDYQSEDGSAQAGSDYMAVSGTLIFKPGQMEQMFKIKIIDDDVFEEDEHFFVRLSNVRLQGAKATAGFKLGDPSVTRINILDDDHSGVFGFPEPGLDVSEAVGVFDVVVERRTGARGRVRVPYHTEDGSAKAGKDYIAMKGTLVFDNNENRKTLPLRVMTENSYERSSTLTIHLGKPQIEMSTNPLRSSLRGKPDSVAEKVALEGMPTLGENFVLNVTIKESNEFKDTVDMLVETRASPFIVGTTSWREQFAAAVRVKDGDDEEPPTCFDYALHFIALFWKLLFAFVPPTDLCCGYLCFTFSIFCIGLLTAVIGDVASSFGCTVGVADAVTAITFVALGTSVPDLMHGWICFAISMLWIGILTAIIGDIAGAFGCTVGLADQVTAISLVALGTSLPDTFASKVSAIQDSTADNSVGNVTGSNAVNVFLGIGIAWSIAALYHASHGNAFIVPPGNLAFSVTLFCTEAVIAIIIIFVRRCKPVGGELGGPKTIKYITSAILFSLWVFYLVMSTLEAYDIIEGF